GAAIVELELVGSVPDERVELLEGAGVEQLLDPLPSGELALRVLLLDRLLGAGVNGLVAELAEVGKRLLVGDRVLLSHCRQSRVGASQPRRPSRRRRPCTRRR